MGATTNLYIKSNSVLKVLLGVLIVVPVADEMQLTVEYSVIEI